MKNEQFNNHALYTQALLYDPLYEWVEYSHLDDPTYPPQKRRQGIELHENGSVTFTAYYPDAGTVEVAGIGGTMGTERYSMQKDSQGYFTVTVNTIAPGFHYHEYYVDGIKCINPMVPVGYGCFQPINFFEMPQERIDFFYLKEVPHGSIHMNQYYSKATGSMRNCFVYTPPGYEASGTTRYPVLYLQHGAGESEAGWIWQGKINYIMDNLIAEKKAKEMIIVMNNGYAIVPGSGNPPMLGSISEVITQECIPYIDSVYRTIPTKESRYMAGLSMGGMQAQWTVFHYLPLFSALGMFSSGFVIQDKFADYSSLFADPERFNNELPLLFASYGEQEAPRSLVAKPLLDQLRAQGIHSTLYTTPGYHEWDVWRKSVHQFLQLL